MTRKFMEGLVFGAGFAISFIALWYVASYWVTPALMSSRIDELNERFSSQRIEETPSSNSSARADNHPSVPFHELGVEGQIKQATVIALAKYERSPNGQMKAVIKEFLKKDPNTTLYYNIGDEFPSSSYFPKEGTNYGDGVVIFFTGSPATMSMSMTFSGDRIHGLGDIPLQLFREKCEKPSA